MNLTSAGTWRAPVHELIPVGPLQVKVRVPDGVRVGKLRMLVSRQEKQPAVEDGWLRFEIKSLVDHEVVVSS